MKNWIITSVLIVLINSFIAVPAYSGTFSAKQDENDAVFLSKGWRVVPKKEVEENIHVPYLIEATYPQITGDSLSANAEKFNQMVRDTVEQEIEQFKNYVKVDMVHMQTLPESEKHNSLRIDYDIDVVKPGAEALISVRLSSEGFQAGRAHPYHNKSVLNFDLASGKVLTLDSLFKPNSAYLALFSTYVNKKLTEKLSDKWMIAEGTKPLAKNFKNWNLASDSIVITFDEYQVAPYVNGSPEVEIPYSVVKKIISPTAPIYLCVVDPESCVEKQ